MKGCRHFRRDALAGLALFLGVELQAESPPVPPSASSPPRSLSPKITEAITAKLPKYEAPVPSPAPAVDSPHPRVGDSADDLLTLPKITVRPAEKGPESDYAWLSPKGRLDLAMKTHSGLRAGNLFGLNGGIALAMQQEEREAKARAAVVDLVERTTVDDSAEAKRIRRLMKAAVQRPNADWLVGRSGN